MIKIDRRAAPAKEGPLERVRVHGIQVDISLPAIRRFLYGEDIDAIWTTLTAEFDYRWQIFKDGQFLRGPSLRETTKRWMALHLSIDGEGAICSLTFNKDLLCNPPLGGLFQISAPLKMSTLDLVPLVFKLWGERNLSALVYHPYKNRQMKGEEMSTQQPRT